jgi:glycosyltransferase involved in cell wall biosynthesis
MTWLTSALSHRVICISPSLRLRALELGLVAADKAVVLGAGSSNGIDLGRFTATDRDRAGAAALRRRLGIAGPVMGFVGRIARDKGMVELSRAWQILRRAHPDLHWLIVGPPDASDPVPGALMAELEGDERVHLLGPTDDVIPAYLAMDVLVLPTHREGFGNVLVEAGALELPVVATAVTGCVDAVADGVTGTLVRPGDVEELAAAVDAYLCDPALRQAHGRAGRVRAEELFDQQRLWARMHREYLDLARAAGLVAGSG